MPVRRGRIRRDLGKALSAADHLTDEDAALVAMARTLSDQLDHQARISQLHLDVDASPTAEARAVADLSYRLLQVLRELELTPATRRPAEDTEDDDDAITSLRDQLRGARAPAAADRNAATA